MCRDCHQLANVQADTVKKELEHRYDAPLHIPPKPQDAVTKRARSFASAMVSERANKIPELRRQEMLDALRLFINSRQDLVGTHRIHPHGPIPSEILHRISAMKAVQPEDDEDLDHSHGKKIVEAQKDHRAFIIGWRQLFLDSMKPKHLPKGWSVDNPLPSPEDQEDRIESRN
mmetsp:Transcript_36598/g.57166  ORF Transcript_36598/g.57166 Transcript_36598/m.57166 type:complete len:173 (-) Transcript_36598:49-567(-)